MTRSTTAHKKKTRKQCARPGCERWFWTSNEKRKYHSRHCSQMSYFDRQRDKLRRANEIIGAGR